MRPFIVVLLLAASASAAYLPKNRPYHVERYSLDVQLDVESGRFESGERIQLVPTSAIREIELDSEDLEILEAKDESSGAKLSFKTFPQNETLVIEAGRELEPGKPFALELRYRGRATNDPDGLARGTDSSDPKRLPYYYTQFESIYARRFFPCDDEPYDKARTELSAELDARYQAISNGRLVEDRVANGRRHVRWELDRPHSTYLVSFVAGQFDTLDGTAAGVPVRIYTAPGKSREARLAMQVVEKAMPFFNRYFGVRYPWKSYGMIGIPGFFWEGMENTTLSTITDSEMSLEDPSSRIPETEIVATVAHELAHQWFGDSVTMEWWDDVWLNEAFASYMETMAGDEFFGNDAALIASVTNSWGLYFSEEHGPKSHPIVSDELPSPEDAFDWTNYVKGCHVLRMLEYYVGERAFREGVRDYLTRFRYGNATYRDFISSIERASKQDLSAFVDGWLKKRGYPILDARQSWDEGKKTLALEVKQTPIHPEDKVVFDFKIPVAFHRRTPPAYDRVVTLWVREPSLSASFSLPAKPEWVSWNPGAPVLAQIHSDAPSDGLRRQALDDPDTIARLAALFELAEPSTSRKEKEVAPLPKETAACLAKSLLSDPSPYVRGALLGKLESVQTSHLPEPLESVVLKLAKEPLAFAKNDELGSLGVQTAAISLLGKTSSAEGRSYVEGLLADRSAGLDLVSAAASAEAMYSDARSVEKLNEALQVQGPRGFAFRKAIRIAFGSVDNVAALKELSAILVGPEMNDEIYLGVLHRLKENELVKNSKPGADWLAALALDDSIGEGIRAEIVGVWDEAGNSAVKASIARVARDSKSDRIRQLAREILENNFD